MIAGAVMLASGALCLGGAVISRSRLGIAAAAIMALAMADLVLLGLVPPLAWAVLLVGAGIALGLGLRLAAGAGAGAGREAGSGAAGSAASGIGPMPRAVMIASALAYPAMAWLVLAHDHAAPAAGAHTGHGSFAALLPLLAIAPLVAVLLALAAVTAARRAGGLAVESGAMAAMLLAMSLPGVL